MVKVVVRRLYERYIVILAPRRNLKNNKVPSSGFGDIQVSRNVGTDVALYTRDRHRRRRRRRRDA